MNHALRPFLSIALLRAGPQDIPASGRMLAFGVTAYVLLGIVIALPLHGMESAVLQALADAGLLAAFVWGLLRMRGRAARMRQTYTALLGVGTLIGCFLLSVTLMLPGGENATPAGGFAAFLYLVLVSWLLLAWGHIFRNAFDLGWLGWGVLVALSFLVISAVLLDWLVGTPKPL